MFSSTKASYPWGLRFEREINSSDSWNAYAAEQQLAMAFMNRTGVNWDERYYGKVVTNYPALTDFPAFVLYASDGATVLDAFTFTSNVTFTAAAFVSRINGVLLAKGYLFEDVDRWEPGDNSEVGATVLDFKTFSQHQYHEIGVTPGDTEDWFKFSALSGRRYKLQIPDSDLLTGFSQAPSKALFNVTTNTFPAGVATNAPALAGVTTSRDSAVTNVISLGVYTTSEFTVTNTLPYSEHLVSNAVLSAETNALVSGITFVNTTLLVTNLPSASARTFTNGAPAKLLAPVVTLLDPARQTRLDLDAGPFGTTNRLLLTALTNGCLFTVPAQYNNQYCFLNVNWDKSSNSPAAFDAVTYSPPATNLTVSTTVSNLTAAVVSRQTVSNVWLTVTYSTPTNLPGDEAAVIISSNLVVETSLLTVTNTYGSAVIFTSTNSVVTEGSNVVTFSGNCRYTLNYRLWEPGEVGFSSTNVQVSESAASVQLSVTRKDGSGGAVHLRYRFEDADTPGRGYEAENGKDFKAVEGTLFWAEGQTGSTNITVQLVQDLRPTWEGPERFAVVLSRYEESAYFQAAVSAASTAVVTLRESARKSAGTLGFAGSSVTEDGPATPFPTAAKPAVTVSEGAAVTLWVARAGGSDGPVRVRVTTANGTAKAPADFDALLQTLEWADGETGPKAVTIQTQDRDGFNRDTRFMVTLANELNASFSAAASVTVTLRDTAASLSLADTAAAAARHGATFKSATGNWFWSDASTLRCEPISRPGGSALSLTLTGPGVLTFDWGVNNGADADRLLCAGGVLVTKSLAAAGPTASVLLKPGKQTVTWTFTRVPPVVAQDDVFAFIRNLKWQPMASATSPTPEPNARTCDLNLTWQMPPTVAVSLGGDFETDGEAGLVQTATVTATSPAGAALANVTGAAFPALWGAPAPVAKRTYTWRVDTVFTNADGRLTRSGTPWSFTGISVGSATTELPPEGFQAASGSYEAVQGARCDFGAISEDPDTTYAVVSGALPAGLTLVTATGRIAGVPAKPGTWSVLLQATSAAAGSRMPCATAALTFTVHPLGTFAGTYTGWIKDAASSVGYSGMTTLTVSESGPLTAKVTARGAAYSFSAKAFDEADDVTAPGSVTLDTCAGGSVAGPDKALYTNTLDNLVIAGDGTATASLTLYTRVRGVGTDEVVPTVYAVELFRSRWGEPSLQPVIDAFEGYYTVALPVTDARDPDNTPWGSGYATLTVSDKGAAKLSGVLADGKAWSLATTLLVFDTNDTSTAAVYVFTQPADYVGQGGLSGLLRITAGAGVYGNTVDCPDAELQWWNFTPASVLGATNATPSEAAGFLDGLGASGGFYDTLLNLRTYYLCKGLSFEDNGAFPGSGLLDRLPADADGVNGSSNYLLLSGQGFLPLGTAVDVAGRSLSVKARHVVSNDTDAATSSLTDSIDWEQSRNVAGLSFAFNPSSGLISGAFDLVYERENANGQFVRRTRKTGYKGVYTPVHPVLDAGDPSEGVQGAGFYLVPDTSAYLDSAGGVHSYTFNWSFGFELLSAEAHDTTWCDGDVTHE